MVGVVEADYMSEARFTLSEYPLIQYDEQVLSEIMKKIQTPGPRPKLGEFIIEIGCTRMLQRVLWYFWNVRKIYQLERMACHQRPVCKHSGTSNNYCAYSQIMHNLIILSCISPRSPTQRALRFRNQSEINTLESTDQNNSVKHKDW